MTKSNDYSETTIVVHATPLLSRRELLCDRKNPYAHFTPRKLCWTVVWSTTVAAVPIVNGVVLEAAKEVRL